MSDDYQKQVLERLDSIQRDFQRLLSMFKALNAKELSQTKEEILKHEIRRKIYDLCDGRLTVNEIAERFKETRQNVTYHLSVLNSTGLVSFKEDGRERDITIKHWNKVIL